MLRPQDPLVMGDVLVMGSLSGSGCLMSGSNSLLPEAEVLGMVFGASGYCVMP